ncbi:hypothetical protein [Nocardia sp. NPDC049707]|uniref:hypothetical protein n=1 Tax=Nocardia sp. NPDC049707 TaxID=3154735 RepID=UPI003427FCF3
MTHYYGQQYFPQIQPDLLTDPDRIIEELPRLAAAGADDVVLFPCATAREQVGLLADVLDNAGVGAIYTAEPIARAGAERSEVHS